MMVLWQVLLNSRQISQYSVSVGLSITVPVFVVQFLGSSNTLPDKLFHVFVNFPKSAHGIIICLFFPVSIDFDHAARKQNR